MKQRSYRNCRGKSRFLNRLKNEEREITSLILLFRRKFGTKKATQKISPQNKKKHAQVGFIGLFQIFVKILKIQHFICYTKLIEQVLDIILD